MLLATLSGLVPGAYAVRATVLQPDGAEQQTVTSDTSGPVVSARAAFVVDITVGAELWSHAPDEPLAPASTTKLITALVARKVLALDDWVTITEDDLVDPTVYSHAGLRPGDRVRVHDLLTALLVASAGDAARALARAGGERLTLAGIAPREAFVAAMNEEARRLGMMRSRFLNPDGRDAPGQVTTARDLAIAAAALLADPVLAVMVDTERAVIAVDGPHARSITMTNTNLLVGRADVLGVKTGTSPEAGQCLVLAVQRGSDTVVVVVLGSRDRYVDVESILEWLDTRYRWITLDGRSFPELARLEADGIVPALVPTVLVPVEELARVGVAIEFQRDANRRAGRVRLHLGTVELFVVPLIRVDGVR